jgi:ABC-type oligopeptide transport system substrate-binding subunit/DNA-binding SARP family transcriptional activator
MLQAKLLGQYEIRIDGQLVIISSRPYQSLLAYLLLHPNKSHRRDKLAGQFWPAASESNARSNLRHALWRIRKALGPGASLHLESDDLGVSYHPQPGDQLDVDTFEACAEDDGNTDALLLGVSAYGGDLLPGFYEEWVVLERERLNAAFERTLGKLLERLLAERRWNEALRWGEHWVAVGTVPEPAYRALMLAHAGLGNLAGAAAQYQRCAEVLSRELDVEPSERTRIAYEQILGRGTQVVLPKFNMSDPISILPAFFDEPERPRPVFVGREAELATLDGYLDKARQGQAHVVFVRGEPGSGKSTLLQAFMRHSLAAHPDILVGWGTCNAFIGQGDPYLPFRDVLNVLAGGIESLYADGLISRNQARKLLASFPWVIQAVVEQSPGLINSFLSSSILAARVAAILPCEPTWSQRIEKFTSSELASAGERDKDQLFEQYTQVLRCIAGKHPLLILLDDLQWMDPGSGQLLFHLVRRLQNTCILIACAYRGEDIALGRAGERHPLEPLLNELQSSFGEIVIDMDRARETSGKDFVDAFLDTEPNRLDDAFRQELYRQTQGHPLFTIQLLRNLQERGEILPDEQGHWIASTRLNWGSLPPQVEGIIGERIGRLDRELQDLLLVASVEGEQFTLQVLERVQGKAGKVILRQLSRELEKRHRLVQELGETCVGGQRLVRFRFVHALIQQYLYSQLGNAERAVLHQEIAEILEMLYKEDLAVVAVPLARHYCEAGNSEKAVKYLLQAGDQARSLYAHQEAVDHYQQALAYLKEMGATEQTARTLMKLYLVYHSSFDFQHAQQALGEYNILWERLAERESKQLLSFAQTPYRLPAIKEPTLDPGLCMSLFDLGWIKELFCGLVECSDDRSILPLAAESWEVQDGGRRYIFHLRRDLSWSDGEPVTAHDFEFAWKRVLDPATHSFLASTLYDILGSKDFHQGRVEDSESVGITALDLYTLIVELEEPCSYFPYILGEPVTFAIPRHVVEREGDAWTEPGLIVTNGAFQLESWDRPSGNAILFSRNPHFFGSSKGNIERVSIVIHKNELDIYQSFIAGKLDKVEFLIPPLRRDELKHYQELGQLQISNVPFVDAIYFVTDHPPFNNPDLRRAFVLATDREELAREIENQLPATGGYIPPGLPGHSPDIGLPYNPREAQRILAAAGYSQGMGFPPVSLLINIVGLEKGDNHVFVLLQKMWKENLGITIQKCMPDSTTVKFGAKQDYHFFFVGALADFPDPASFLQSNFMLDHTQWQNPKFKTMIEEARHSFDQRQRMDLYRRADRALIEKAVVLPLFYGSICELIQPWVRKPTGSSIYNPKWKDIIIMPH